jgi:hypothetical protein
MHNGTRRNSRRALVAIAAAAVAIAAATSAWAGPPPSPSPGDPGCVGRDTANFAQDWKSFSFEPSGVSRLVRFYGGTNPTDWLQSERYGDCAVSP